MKNLNSISRLIFNWLDQAKILTTPKTLQVPIEKRQPIDFSEMSKK